jgi:WD40 repeat protein
VLRAAPIFLILLASRAHAAKCDGAAAAQPVRDLLAKGQLVQALAEGETAAKTCQSAATQLALADVQAELWLRDRAAAAYRKASLAGTPEEKEAAKRGLEAIRSAGPTPSIQDLIRDGHWMRVVAHAEARRLPAAPFVWSGHSGAIEAVAWGAATIATGARDKTIKLWDAESGRGTGTLGGHLDRVVDLAFSADGKLLASGAADRTARIWDVGARRELRSIAAHDSVVSAVAFSPDGKRLATGGWDAKVKLWDVDTGRQILLFAGHTDSIVRIVFNRDGSRLATISRDGALRLWDAMTAAEVKTKLPDKDVTDLAFLADGGVVLGQRDGVRRWDAGGKAIRRYSAQQAIRVWAGDRLIAMFGKNVLLVDASTGAEMRFLPAGESADAAVSPDLARVVLADRNAATIRSFASPEAKRLGSVAAPITALGWIGKTLVAGGDGFMRWDLESPPTRSDGPLLGVGTDAFVVMRQTRVEVLDVAGVVKKTIDLDALAAGCPVRAATVRANGEILAAALACRGAQRFGDDVREIALSPDEKQIVTIAVVRPASVARPEAELAVWPAASGPARVTKRIAVEETAVAVSKAGLVATGGREMALWRLGSLQKVRAFAPTASPVTALGFSGDGRLLASGHADGTIAFWDVPSGRRRGILVVADDGRWQYAAEDGHGDGDGDFISLSIAGAITPPGVTRARVRGLSPLSR